MPHTLRHVDFSQSTSIELHVLFSEHLAPVNHIDLLPELQELIIFSSKNEKLAYESGVNKVCMSKPGYRSKARQRIEKQRWFKQGLRFRAGIEGIISVLMRSYGFKRCLWKGWESFQSYVGLSVVTFNLQKIATLT
jgi:hypothetical protein